MANRVVITSIGIISALGFSAEEIVRNLQDDGAAFERPAFDDEVCVCPVGDGFRLKDFTGRYKNARYLNRGAGFSVAAAMSALKGAGLAEQMLAGAGLFVGIGPNLDLGGEFPEIRQGNLDRQTLAALWMLKFLPNTAASAISDLAGIHGENSTVGTACSASLQAIGEAFRKIKDGYLKVALAGGEIQNLVQVGFWPTAWHRLSGQTGRRGDSLRHQGLCHPITPAGKIHLVTSAPSIDTGGVLFAAREGPFSSWKTSNTQKSAPHGFWARCAALGSPWTLST